MRVVCLFVFSVTVAAGAITQFMAHELFYQDALTGVLYEASDYRLYFPFACFWWQYFFYDDIPALAADSLELFLILFSIVFVCSSVIYNSFRSRTTTAYGSARWAKKDEIKKANLLDGKGVFLGSLPSGEYLRDYGKTHDLIVAATRSGKGIGVIIPSCFTWRDSLVIIDPKGEAWDITAGWRKQNLKNRVYKFAPGSLESDHFNPLEEVRFGSVYENKDVTNIAQIICTPSGGRSEEDHWSEAAKDLLIGIIIHIKYAKGYVSISDCLDFLTDLSEKEAVLQDKLLNLASYQHDPAQQLLAEIRKNRNGTHLTVQQIFTRMGQTPEREFGSIYSTLSAFLSVYRDPILSINLSNSDFKIEGIMNGDVPVSVYLVISPDDLKRLAPVLRLFVELLYGRNTEKLEQANGMSLKRRLLIIVDEFPALGKMKKFEYALAFLAGYGVKSVIITQSVNQLYDIYGKNNTFFSNAHMRLFFTPNDLESAKYISAMLGRKTVKVYNKELGRNVFSFFGNRTEHETARDLMTPEEVLQMDNDKNGILFVGGQRPIFTEKIKWFSDENFKNKKLPPPDIARHDDEATDKIVAEKIKAWFDEIGIKELELPRQEPVNSLETAWPEDDIMNPFYDEGAIEDEYRE